MTDQQWMDYRLEEAVWRPDSESCLQFSLIKSTPGGFLAAFGVGRGQSLNLLADLTDETVHGFDTFGQTGDGTSTNGTSEQARNDESVRGFCASSSTATLDARETRCQTTGWRELRFAFNARLWPGLLCETLPLFLDGVRAPARFVHLSCHRYQDALEVLMGLETRIVRGTVMQFEWLWNYPAWQEGAFRALREFATATGREFRFLARTSGTQATVMFR